MIAGMGNPPLPASGSLWVQLDRVSVLFPRGRPCSRAGVSGHCFINELWVVQWPSMGQDDARPEPIIAFLTFFCPDGATDVSPEGRSATEMVCR